MKTFTITDRVVRGIKLGGNTAEGREAKIYDIPVGQGIIKELEGHDIQAKPVMLMALDEVSRQHGDEITTERLVRESNVRDSRALVAVETAAGVGGNVKLFANTITEHLEEQSRRIVRKARDIEDAVGVQVLAEKFVEEGTRFLVAMQPGASFRIVRSGNLQGAPPELVVSWHGRYDHKGWCQERAARRAALKDPDYVPAESIEDFQDRMMGFWKLSVHARSVRHGEV